MINTYEQPAYIIVPQPGNFEVWPDKKIKAEIEDGDVSQKIEALRCLIYMVSAGQKLGKDILMHVIRFLIPVENKTVKKMLLLFWELFPKYQPDGKMIHEMILVCDAYRKDLQHPNEYIRGSILRFLCKLKEPELIEPIMPAVRQCLDHKTAYVRRNAILAIFTIYKNFDYLVPDAPELLERFLDNEVDSSCQRNAYMMLIDCDQKRAINYLKTKVHSVLSFNDVLQLSIIELIYKVSVELEDKNSYTSYLYELLCSDSSAVQYSAANTLLSLSDSPSAFEYAAKCYVNLIIKESDNNVRLTLIDRLLQIHSLKKYDWIFHSLLLDLLSVLDGGGSDCIIDLMLARKIIQFVNDLLPPELSLSAMDFIRKELIRIQKRYVTLTDKKKLSSSNREVIEYHRLIIKFIKSLVEKHLDIHESVIPILISNILPSHFTVSQDILDIIRMIVCIFSQSRDYVFNEFQLILANLSDPNVFRSSLWISVSCLSRFEQVESLVSLIDSLISKDSSPLKLRGETSRPNVIIAQDGTYVTQTTNVIEKCDIPLLNKFIMENDSHVCSSVATLLCKIVAFADKINSNDYVAKNKLSAKIINILIKMIHVYEDKFKDIQNMDIQRIIAMVNMLVSSDPHFMKNFLTASEHLSLDCMKAKNVDDQTDLIINNVEAPKQDNQWKISFSSIVESVKVTKTENIYNQSLLMATGRLQKEDSFSITNKVIPLTGLSDPVYAEAYIKIKNFDIHFDVLVINQTDDLIQNVSLDMRTQGDFKVISKYPPFTLSPMKFSNIDMCLRLTSSENYVIYGNISYDTSGHARESFSVILDEVSLDLTETVQSTKCSPDAFQKMWAEFEWENKIPVLVPLVDFSQFLSRIVQETRMSAINEDPIDDCKYLAVNLYSKNMFGDEALANISVEKDLDSDKIVGQIRIRAKTQTIALTLGNKLAEILKKN